MELNDVNSNSENVVAINLKLFHLLLYENYSLLKFLVYI